MVLPRRSKSPKQPLIPAPRSSFRHFEVRDYRICVYAFSLRYYMSHYRQTNRSTRRNHRSLKIHDIKKRAKCLITLHVLCGESALITTTLQITTHLRFSNFAGVKNIELNIANFYKPICEAPATMYECLQLCHDTEA